jgi:hypothetical protein
VEYGDCVSDGLWICSGERRVFIGRIVDVYWRKEVVYTTECVCIEENGERVSDCSKCLEEKRDCVSKQVH